MAFKTSTPLAVGLLLVMATAPYARPRFSVRTGHDCSKCHVSPSGGGMRSVGGRRYSTHGLPMFAEQPPPKDVLAIPTGPQFQQVYALGFGMNTRVINEHSDTQNARQAPLKTSTTADVPTASSEDVETPGQVTDEYANRQASPRANSVVSGQPWIRVSNRTYSGQTATEEDVASSRPVTDALTARTVSLSTRSHDPTFQVGGNLRLAYAAMLSDVEDSVVFPMQTELYLAYRPYNPMSQHTGRLTLAVSAGALSARDQGFDNYGDRLGIGEWYALYDNLPNRMYARIGRFLPAHGWRTDDDRGFSRQGQNILGSPFDHNRQVTGIETGFNEGGTYGHISVFNAANAWDNPVDTDAFNGLAIASGYRMRTWQAGGSLIYGHRGDVDDQPVANQVAASAQWALNLDALTGTVPLIYLGEFNLNSIFPATGLDIIGLSAFHEVGWLVSKGLNFIVRYDWMDPDIEIKFDTQHRQTTELNWFPVPYVELSLRYQHNWRHTDDRFKFYQSLDTDGETVNKADADEVLFLIHGFY